LLESDTHRAHSELYFVSEAILDGAGPASPKIRKVIASTGKSLEDLATELRADEVVVAVDEKRGLAIEKLLNFKISGVPVIEYDALLERETGRIDLRWLELSWLVYSPGFEVKLLDAILKRTLDIAISAALLVIAMPALMVAMVAVKLEDRGPIFYRQTRVTRGGREFWIYKLRTMRVDAESDGVAQLSQEGDPRVIPACRWVRATRADELPQILHIVTGKMSIVGPRPERPELTAGFEKEIAGYTRRHEVPPGLTGLAQIHGRYHTDAEYKLGYDLQYLVNWSPVLDLEIIARTIWVILARRV